MSGKLSAGFQGAGVVVDALVKDGQVTLLLNSFFGVLRLFLVNVLVIVPTLPSDRCSVTLVQVRPTLRLALKLKVLSRRNPIRPMTTTLPRRPPSACWKWPCG